VKEGYGSTWISGLGPKEIGCIFLDKGREIGSDKDL
jgi:hypothetical protein